jgi:hypothetical protein
MVSLRNPFKGDNSLNTLPPSCQQDYRSKEPGFPQLPATIVAGGISTGSDHSREKLPGCLSINRPRLDRNRLPRPYCRATAFSGMPHRPFSFWERILPTGLFKTALRHIVSTIGSGAYLDDPPALNSKVVVLPVGKRGFRLRRHASGQIQVIGGYITLQFC